jgi:uncharacterized membrane protein YbhN (UPF0104 family)
MRPALAFLRAKIGLIAKAVISALLVALILTRVDLAGVRQSLGAASIPKLAVAFAVFLAMPLFGGVRWWLALRGIGERARLPEITVLFSTASVVGQVLPSVAGDGLRIWLASRLGHGLRAAFQSVLIERVFMILGLLSLALATSPLLAARTGDRGPIWISAALFAAGFAGFGVLLAADRAPGLLGALKPWRALASGAAAAQRLVTSRWGALLAGAALLSNLLFALGAFLLGRALGLHATLWDMVAIMPTVTLATTLPISLGGWGVREGVLVLLLGRIGVPAAEALSLSLLFGLFGMMSGFPGLLAWVIGWRRRTRSAPGPVALN